MKLVRVNHDAPVIGFAADMVRVAPLTDVKLEAGNVYVTVFERSDGDVVVQVDPIGRDFIDNLYVAEASIGRSQVRLVGIEGRMSESAAAVYARAEQQRASQQDKP